jgi:hypothetical protein
MSTAFSALDFGQGSSLAVWRTLTVSEAIDLIAQYWNCSRDPFERVVDLQLMLKLGDRVYFRVVDAQDPDLDSWGYIHSKKYGIRYWGAILATRGKHHFIKVFPKVPEIGQKVTEHFIFGGVFSVDDELGPEP